MSRIPTSTPSPAKKHDEFKNDIRKELQRYLAACAYHSMRTSSLKEKQQLKEIEKRFHGQGDMVGVVWKFMNKKESYFQIMFYLDELHQPGVSSYLIDPKFTRSDKKLVLNENVTSDLIKRSFMSKPQTLQGKTLMNMAKLEEREAKKILSQMNEAVKVGIIHRKTEGEYEYASGKTEQDLDDFLIFRMYHWSKIYGPSGDDNDDGNVNDTEESENAVIAILDEDDIADLPGAPADELPTGWFLFKARGPMAEEQDRYDLLNSGKTANGNGDNGRKNTRKQQKKAKDNSRDYAVGNGDGGRGMPMGGSYKDLAIIAQTERKLSVQQHATRIAQLSSALSSKNDRLKSTIDTVRTMNDIGLKEKAKEIAEQIPKLMDEIKELEDEIRNLKEEKSQVDTEAAVDLYIERGSEAMGVKRKKKKSLVSSITGVKRTKSLVSSITGDSGSYDTANNGDTESDDDDDDAN